MPTITKFRIDVDVNDLLTNSNQRAPAPAAPRGLALPDPTFPQFQDRLHDPGPDVQVEEEFRLAKLHELSNHRFIGN